MKGDAAHPQTLIFPMERGGTRSRCPGPFRKHPPPRPTAAVGDNFNFLCFSPVGLGCRGVGRRGGRMGMAAVSAHISPLGRWVQPI